MQRVTLTLEEDLVAEIDQLMQRRGYQSRSEAVRDIVRAGFQHIEADEDGAGKSCVAALVYVYDRDVRELAKRLAEMRTAHHDLMVATTSVGLDHKSCMEVALMRGETRQVRQVSDQIVTERGVRYGRLLVVPVDVERVSHQHGDGFPHVHDHFKVRHGG